MIHHKIGLKRDINKGMVISVLYAGYRRGSQFICCTDRDKYCFFLPESAYSFLKMEISAM